MQVKQALPANAEPMTQVGLPHRHFAPCLWSASADRRADIASRRDLSCGLAFIWRSTYLSRETKVNPALCMNRSCPSCFMIPRRRSITARYASSLRAPLPREYYQMCRSPGRLHQGPVLLHGRCHDRHQIRGLSPTAYGTRGFGIMTDCLIAGERKQNWGRGAEGRPCTAHSGQGRQKCTDAADRRMDGRVRPTTEPLSRLSGKEEVTEPGGTQTER